VLPLIYKARQMSHYITEIWQSLDSQSCLSVLNTNSQNRYDWLQGYFIPVQNCL